jgi:hypothetical protein
MPDPLLSPVHYRTHRGERPMQTEWNLGSGMPARDFQGMKVAAGWLRLGWPEGRRCWSRRADSNR